MRRFIIDTDTATDDAAALILAAKGSAVQIMGITTVAGNVPLEQATRNALMTLEVCGCEIPVYAGAHKPMERPMPKTVSVHGNDGMGDRDIIHPVTAPRDTSAMDFILDTVRSHPDEIEIVALGPVTNLALAILAEPDTMRRVKHIWSMGTPGFGAGNVTPIAEFNVFVDAEAYAVMLEAGIPITVAGFDLCLGDTALNADDMKLLESGNAIGRFMSQATTALLQFNLSTRGAYLIDLPDAVAMAAALYDGFVTHSVDCYAKCCTYDNETYGQVILYREDCTYEAIGELPACNVSVITSVDAELFKKKLLQVMTE